MLNLAWAQLRAHPARLFAVLLAVVLGTLFLAATAVFSSTSSAGLRAVAAAPLTVADVVVDLDPQGADPGPDWADRVAAHPDVTAVAPVHARTVEVVTDALRGTANVYGLADDPGLRWFDLVEGDWPTGPDEVVADTATLESLGLAVGDTVRLVGGHDPAREGRAGERVHEDGAGDSAREGAAAGGAVGDAAPEGADVAPAVDAPQGAGAADSTHEVTVVGSTDPGFRPLTGVRHTFHAPAAYFAGDTPLTVLASTVDGVAPQDAVDGLTGALPGDLHVMTAEEQSRMAADRFAGGSQQLGLLLLVCALMALLAAAMVISNTFTILLSQRRRDTALLRLVGADRRQLRELVVTEALLIGLTGSLIGAGAGIAAGYAGASLAGMAGDGLRLAPLPLLGCVAAGVGTTVAAAWFPARSASTTAPVEALRSAPLDDGVHLRRRHVLGALLALTGLATMALGTWTGSLPLAIAGGFAGAIGLLLALRHLIARLLRWAHGPLRRMGGVADLAGANLRRDTGRAATATLALVLGLGLISALTTAAATGRATIDGDLDSRYPVEVSARADTGSVDTDTVERIRAIEGLEFVEAPRTAPVTVQGWDGVTLIGVSPRLAEVVGADELLGTGTGTGVGGGSDRGATGGTEPVMLVSGDQLKALGAVPGQSTELVLDGTARTFTLYPSALATASGTAAPVVLEDVLDGVTRGWDQGVVWGVAAPGADREHLADQMDLAAGADPGVAVSGALSERRDLTEILDLLVALALVMLLVTVVISSLGVANTLSLSVLERTRETALLRALGLSRGGLRGTLAVEAVVISLLGVVLGVLVGLPYGVLGVGAIVGRTAPLVVSVPWAQLGLLPVAALAIGVLATLAPAVRATRIAPAEGLTRA
ncbi:FtsX-like permease family protein [Nocardiopsis sp. NPDC007018]|uniref:FtsX-like permease family protein n=1 Tax=Nocardiopsis sp. NPDC007018 TaxID=3155721 RepID=UPI003404D7E8